MPKNPHNQDSRDFAVRLKEAMSDGGINTGHGAGAALGRRYKTATVTANAWLNGEHMPAPDRVRVMADDLGVRFEWLYFGEMPKRAAQVDAANLQAPLTLSAHEQQLIRKYRAAGEALQGLVDAALKGTSGTATSKAKVTKK